MREACSRGSQDRSLYDRLMAQAFELASRSLADTPDEHTLFVEGTASLLDDVTQNAELSLATLQALLQMIEEKQRLVRLLNEYIDGPGLTVVIGAEHPDPILRPFSLVASTYDDGQGTGSVGVIGPTRMRYSRAIAVVDGAAQAVSRVLRIPTSQPRDRHAGARQRLGSSSRTTPAKRSVMTEEANETPALPQDGTPDPDAADPDVAADDRSRRLKRERDEYHDRLLRKTAEFDNYRKRIERERRETSERAAASLLEDLLPSSTTSSAR